MNRQRIDTFFAVSGNEGRSRYEHAALGTGPGTSAPPQIISLWEENLFDIHVSEHIIDGVSRALRKPYWQRRLDLHQLEYRLSNLRVRVKSVVPVPGVHGVAEDDEDDLILATALAAKADYLVTGDKNLQVLGTFRGVSIVSPREFVDVFSDLPSGT